MPVDNQHSQIYLANTGLNPPSILHGALVTTGSLWLASLSSPSSVFFFQFFAFENLGEVSEKISKISQNLHLKKLKMTNLVERKTLGQNLGIIG
jgi:hypothetical protein